tara:strand:+ start:59 stop:244 length:186 start_codon:yes stop_codon:yes gene_type:complete
MKSKTNNKTKGKVMVAIGFIMIIFNALGYILAWETDLTIIFILGLVFAAVGLRMARGKGRF